MGLNLGPPGLRCDDVDLADWVGSTGGSGSPRDAQGDGRSPAQPTTWCACGI
jgi:hypothetical protein